MAAFPGLQEPLGSVEVTEEMVLRELVVCLDARDSLDSVESRVLQDDLVPEVGRETVEKTE